MRTATLDEVPGLKLAIGAPSRATGGANTPTRDDPPVSGWRTRLRGPTVHLESLGERVDIIVFSVDAIAFFSDDFSHRQELAR